MKAGTSAVSARHVDAATADSAITPARKVSYTVGVRMQLGDDLEGLEAYRDGISFRSPSPIAAGQRMELVLCNAISMEAEVVGCVPLSDSEGGHLVRARFHNTSAALNALIHEELTRLINESG